MLFDVIDEDLADDILIETKTVSGFSQTAVWSEVATVKGRIYSLSGGKTEDYSQPAVRATHRILMRRTAITENDRVTVNSKVYLVRWVNLKRHLSDEFLQVDVEFVETVQ